jgi:hypothetical protein
MARTVAARRLLVWLHVVTSVGWMGQALALMALLAAAVSADDRGAQLRAARLPGAPPAPDGEQPGRMVALGQ